MSIYFQNFVIFKLDFLYIKSGVNLEIIILLILGFVQGLCEFLPISSSGHLVFLSEIFGVQDSLFVSIILHVATLLSIFVVFRKDVINMIRHPFSEKNINIYLATIPTCIFALAFMSLITSSFEGGFLPYAFLITAILLYTCEKMTKKEKFIGLKKGQIDWKKALVMGTMQGIAVFPGISRSGMTIAGGLIAGGDREEVAKFSFLMSIPIILLSLIMEIVKFALFDYSISVNALGISLSFVVAFITGILSISAMLALTKRANFKWFSLYLIIMSIMSFIFL